MYWLIIIVTLALGLGTSAYVKSQFKKYSQTVSSFGATGAQVAQRMLAAHGVTGVRVYRGQEGADHFDPTTNSISLSPSVYDYPSVTAVATACHEVGHACQFAESYTPLKVRSAIVPVVNLASNAWMFVLFIGIFLNIMGFVNLAIALYAAVVVFQLVTLPVEFNASHRAMNYLNACAIPQAESKASYSILRACALTYVAAALASLLNLLYLLSFRDN